MTPEELIEEINQKTQRDCERGGMSVHSPYNIIWLCQYARDARRAGAEDALRGMRDWCAKQEESATEEMELAESSGWYEAERELADFRKTYQKVLEHIEQRLAALKEDKTDA